jgi:ABC-2 type transport system permease protein
MQKLLATEWLKLKNYKAFIILGIFFCIGVFVTNYIVYSVNKNIINKIKTGGIITSFNPYDFDKTWQTTSYATGFLLILPALLLIIIITNEFNYRTSRQNVIDGWSRQQFIHVKLMLALIVAVISTLLVIIAALAFGFFSGTSFSTEGISHVGYFFLKALSYNMIAVLISVLIRRTGFAIGLYFIYMGAENIISQLLDVWSLRIRSNTGTDLGSMGDYLPMNASDGLLTFPNNPLRSIAKSQLPTDYFWIVITLTFIYLFLFIWISRRRLIKSDL